jgi:hypothetical protein
VRRGGLHDPRLHPCGGDGCLLRVRRHVSARAGDQCDRAKTTPRPESSAGVLVRGRPRERAIG